MDVQPRDRHRTGVGTPDRHAQPAGAKLGGDTGDIDLPYSTREAAPHAYHEISPSRRRSPREARNPVPGDIIYEDPENLPGGFGTDNPDSDIDAVVDELLTNDEVGPTGTIFTTTLQHGGVTAGTGYVEGVNTGATVDPADLLPEDDA